MGRWAGSGGVGGGGFTVAELMVACVVMGTALVGVYEVFRQAAEIERRASVRWEDRAAAEAVAAHVAESIEGAVMMPKASAIEGRRNEDGSVWIGCLTQARCWSSDRVGHAAIQGRRYTWRPVVEGRGGGVVELKTLAYGGSVNVTVGVGGEERSEGEVWDRVAGVVIGREVREFKVGYRRADRPDGEWEEQFRGGVGNIVIMLRVRVGDEAVERVVLPHANRELLEEAQGRWP